MLWNSENFSVEYYFDVICQLYHVVINSGLSHRDFLPVAIHSIISSWWWDSLFLEGLMVCYNTDCAWVDNTFCLFFICWLSDCRIISSGTLCYTITFYWQYWNIILKNSCAMSDLADGYVYCIYQCHIISNI